ncbi:MAG: capsule assembly Wzi family protein [Bacteroidota bacterium]|nr:capsule assembly Wzi family protein [Bacteroidota bacterium]
MKRFFLLILYSFIIIIGDSYSQVELVNPRDQVYNYLQRMQTMKIIPDYNPANIPISRESIAAFLKIITANTNKISSVDKKILNDYSVEYQYELTGNLNKSSWLTHSLKDIISDSKQKYIYAYSDSNATLFLDALGSISQRESRGDSIGRHSISLGELGFRVRGTLFNSVGYYLRASNGQKLSGDSSDVIFARDTDPKLYAQYKFQYEQRNFDTFDGYIRYRTNQNWLALTVGRNPVFQGFGFIDRLFLSHNTVPFDYLRLDLAYKAVKYSFMYGSLRGDSLGRSLDAKNISTHRLDIQFSNSFKMGFFESVTIANSPFSFTFLNPLNFLTSAELNKASQPGENNVNNSVIGLDAEVIPVKKLAVQGSFLLDDFEFNTLFKSNSKITNKFAWQLGLLWVDAFTLSNLEFITEYTRLDPFVYSHVSNKTQYTHWDLPLGHHLEPNSDEIAVKLNYNLTNRVNLSILYQHQRSANGIVRDSSGFIVRNYGGDINNATGYSYSDPEFLVGNRINRDIISTSLRWQFIRQFYFEIFYVHRMINNIYQSVKFNDDYGFVTLLVDY